MSPGRHDEREPLDLLVEEFVRRVRAGESVAVEAFAAEHSEHRKELLELLPTLQALEQVKRDRESTGGMKARIALPALEQLGDFRIVREVGRGGMGVVFEAVQESLSRRVALKVMPQAALLTGNQLMRFQREAQIAAQLHHSNIVPVFGSGETEGYHWYAMQFIDGTGLDGWRKREGSTPPADSAAWRERSRFVAEVGEQTASALHHAHTQGTLHRDIKPANLLLGGDGQVWVTDFGLAKALEAEGLTQSGDLLGTLQYMAPEQFAGQYDVRSEVYALGLTLYELLTLQPAFTGQNKSELMAAIRSGRRAAIDRLCPEVPADLVTIIDKACRSDPNDRYATAELLQHDLQAFLEDRPISARRQHPLGLLLRWCRRNRAMAALAGVALAAALGAGITGWVAYVVTDDALGRAEAAGGEAREQSQRAEANLRLSLRAFDEVFDALVGRDPVLIFEEDPETGEEEIIAARNVDDEDIALLEKMLRFYDEFAAQNADSQSLRFETARAYRRVGVIQARFRNLDEAAGAYEQALALYRDVTDRDVTRELAAVQIEYGQLEARRRETLAAARRFKSALDLLEREPATRESTALRFDRANAHFQLARIARGGRGFRSWRPDPELRRFDAGAELEKARSILAQLAETDGENPEVRTLEARCLLLSARLRGRDRAAQVADAEAGIALLREVVATHPDRPLIRFELCETLLDRWRRTDRTREGREQRFDALLEARGHADELLRQQSGVEDYRALRARLAVELGGYFARQARDQSGAEQAATVAAAEAELRIACAEGHSGFRSIMAVGQLDALLRAAGRTVEADAELARVFDAVEELAKTGQRPERWFGGARSRSGRERGPYSREAFRGTSDEFKQRFEQMMQALPPRPERSGPGRETRRDSSRRR